MKKLMMIAAMMLMSMGAFAQNEVGQFTLKPMVGMTLPNITNYDGKIKVGLAAGVEAEYGITETFGVSAGVLYSMQGCKNKDVSDYKTTLDYINIPILANYYIVKGLAVKAGIQPGFCVSKKMALKGTATNNGNRLDIDSNEKIEDGIKAFQFAIPVGLSYEYQSFVSHFGFLGYKNEKLKGDDESTKSFGFNLGSEVSFGMYYNF